MALESKNQLKIMAYLKKVPKLYSVKTVVCNTNGHPDILICYRGKFVSIELKKDDKTKAEPLQLYRAEQIREAGGFSYIASSLSEVISIIDSL